MTSGTKYPAFPNNDALLRMREDYAQAAFDLFDEDEATKEVRPNLKVVGHTSNFLNNMRLPVHRWFRYSAGFSAEWVKWLLAERKGSDHRVLDPFVGSGTTCLACDEMGAPSYGLEAHPFVHRVARAKLSYSADPERFLAKAERAFRFTSTAKAANDYPELIQKCFGLETLDFWIAFAAPWKQRKTARVKRNCSGWLSSHRCAPCPRQAQRRGNTFCRAGARPCRLRPKARCTRRCR